MQSTAFRRSAAASTSAGFNSSFAPLTTKMRFCPLGSTNIGATPGHTFHLLDVSGVDAELLEIIDGARTEQIAANPRHHKDRGSAQVGCGRLIGARVSESQIE